MDANSLRKLFYCLNFETLSESEYKGELIRLKNILGCYPKPQRTVKEAAFYDFVEKNILAEYSTRALVNKKFKIKLIFGTMDECIKQKADFYTIQDWINKQGATLVPYLIERAFKKYETELNNILN